MSTFATPGVTPDALTMGLYGKLPSHGDFLRRRVSDAFVAGWDAWLQESIMASREALGDRWLEIYLTSPVWRFACAAGVCGPTGLIGLMVPSVDRVGRYFPLTLVAELPPAITVLAALRESESFLAAAAELVIETLELDPVDFDEFDKRLVALGRERGAMRAPSARLDSSVAAELENEHGGLAWHIPTGSPGQLSSIFEQFLAHRLSSVFGPVSVWWTDGSSAVDGSSLVVGGLPTPESFAALMDGSWSGHGWTAVAVDVEKEAESDPMEDSVVDDLAAPQFRSAAASDVGRMRRVNQDSYLERADVGIWAVADGLGGLSDGEGASRMVCDALADLMPVSEFEQMVESARRRLEEVNAHLHRKSVRSGSTVVAMFARGARCAVVWAGDSRVYRWRDSQLTRLTRDHSIAEEEGNSAPGVANVVTRAIGGEPTLLLDVVYDRTHVGDRYLLCSDGLTRVLTEATIGESLGGDDIRATVDGLITATLGAGAPDNVTALVVEAFY